MTPQSDILLLYAARAMRGFGDGFAIIQKLRHIRIESVSPQSADTDCCKWRVSLVPTASVMKNI